jgi:hypothetical protein
MLTILRLSSKRSWSQGSVSRCTPDWSKSGARRLAPRNGVRVCSRTVVWFWSLQVGWGRFRMSRWVDVLAVVVAECRRQGVALPASPRQVPCSAGSGRLQAEPASLRAVRCGWGRVLGWVFIPVRRRGSARPSVGWWRHR